MDNANQLEPIPWPDGHTVYPEFKEESELLQLDNVERMRQQLLSNDPSLDKEKAKMTAVAIKKHQLHNHFACMQILNKVKHLFSKSDFSS